MLRLAAALSCAAPALAAAAALREGDLGNYRVPNRTAPAPLTQQGLPDDGGDPVLGFPFGDGGGGGTADPHIYPLPLPWRAGSFEIRLFDVGQGDSQLVVFPSGYSVLIDVMEPNANTCAGARAVADKVRAVLGHGRVDVGVLSHHHLDHIGYAENGGFWCLIEEGLLDFGKIIDRDAGHWEGAAAGKECTQFDIKWHNVGSYSGTAWRWICYHDNPASTKIRAIREVAQVGSTTQINPPDANAEVKIVLSDGKGVKTADNRLVSGDHSGEDYPPSENDYSIALLISFGDIRYATAGDADGAYDRSQFGYSYNDVESVLAPLFGEVDILNSNHHGSPHSTNEAFAGALRPQLSFVQCGKDNSYGHPAQVVLDRLSKWGKVFMPNRGVEDRDYSKVTITHEDVVVHSSDGVHFHAHGMNFTAKRARARGNATAEGAVRGRAPG
eukprot:TRINITY_DN23923_c0_g1_i1.p1 TRINITY_DN23923_c0_g1~~TRINITY_DN23923_c0_g1_i1.p1  ORF type:complete len:442 (+),score=130.84 TRINITY_DN23923_c0_g1_i1:82-1407(+)